MSGSFNREFLSPGFLLENTRRKWLIPRLDVDDITKIDIDALKSNGIKAIIFDVDNTLCPHMGAAVDLKLKASFDRIAGNFRCCLLTNAMRQDRRDQLESLFGLPSANNSRKKPHVEAVEEALRLLGTKPEETALVGDRLITDIVGANKAGVYSIKVRPVSFLSEPLLLKLARVFEEMLLIAYKAAG
ncbi:MAG: YqeG family HAD IIIA-type phosphatase [Candidatus Altiarchaeota archaeon]